MLVIKQLSKTYANGIQALRDISLDIGYGIFGLLGPNGAGKSSFMRTLATLQDADSGLIELDGLNLLKNPQTARSRLGYLPQDFGVYPNVSAEDLLDQIAVFKGFTHASQRREIVAQQLQLVNLYEERKQKLGTFSGGMRQRFGIAQALLGSPQLVIVDEPTAGLDPVERIRFQNLLAEISEERVLILSTHIVEDVAELCQQMAILNRGQIIRSGSPLFLTETLRGKVWIASELEASNKPKDCTIITTRMSRGKRCVRVLIDSQQSQYFHAVEPDLNDVYFTALLLEPEVIAA
ncbi:ABC transporter ATP-binding protein [Limnoraphis robusta Tam1]|uniref:ABC transporter ATP-binding protein n=1 Tax=Limnoraphis robusta CCNP1315 TaxID=3110306 RepID=A0ABU5U7Q5_9CYAN|nr:ABC transporter ATP-binding protein [Limnoraphis robusta]MEA5500957.1 ABC transporter ATP-binding protein [Limnoraphis robusta BA-68 BA1]MEA5523209.1 ABC transporter ATP-binding protein [Limnoraphis robusta CCNP1315]MEA5540885.1 ABC transporter ATP-binding protein [Limnoraphis robusta Tam1]MEA5549193.1 ABC transporter ATP-binding protein [Limnoraphis robusta CCNP1324]